MQYLAFDQEDRSLGESVDWLKAQVERIESISLDVHGDTGPEKAKSLVQVILESGAGGEGIPLGFSDASWRVSV